MNRLLAAVLILAFFVSGTPNAIASDFGYELKVNGMVCAFCAYSVSRQLRSEEGVDPDSIVVDLASGTITLRSDKALETARLAELVETAGFALEAVTDTVADSSIPAPASEGAVRISLTLDTEGLVEGEFDSLLQALGLLASQSSSRLVVVAPAALEMRMLRPVLMGRTPAIDVDFSKETRPDNTVLINVLAD